MAKIVTITNPLTGQPAQVDQLDHTAQQIDDGLNIARGVSNPNLLDNWYFGNPIDQRQGRIVKPNTTYYSDNTLATAAGTTSAYVTAYRYATGTANGVNYASFKLENTDTAPTYYAAPENVVRGYTGAGYGIDRWKATNPKSIIHVEDGGIRLEADNSDTFFAQLIENGAVLNGKRAIFTVLTADGVLKSVGGVVDTKNGFIYQDILTDGSSLHLYSNGSNNHLQAHFHVSNGYSVKLKAAKLELGDTQTLAHQENGVWQLNEIPDYGEQLARCQRYQYPIKSADGMRNAIGYGYALSDVTIRITVNLPAPMRDLSSLEWLIGDISHLHLVCNNGTSQDFTPNSVSVFWSADMASVVLQFGVTGAIPLAVYTLCAYNAEVIPMLNANL